MLRRAIFYIVLCCLTSMLVTHNKWVCCGETEPIKHLVFGFPFIFIGNCASLLIQCKAISGKSALYVEKRCHRWIVWDADPRLDFVAAWNPAWKPVLSSSDCPIAFHQYISWWFPIKFLSFFSVVKVRRIFPFGNKQTNCRFIGNEDWTLISLL